MVGDHILDPRNEETFGLLPSLFGSSLIEMTLAMCKVNNRQTPRVANHVFMIERLDPEKLAIGQLERVISTTRVYVRFHFSLYRGTRTTLITILLPFMTGCHSSQFGTVE
ncbi:hypothetical protein AG1IA_05155 [Rhizoctonia solani AG-1 IA]|uniref:Uncharacterized protein n=1 Tax=Thanatephorus cucumeris (strain AG1-IA) TaxID=983506 RepID=L8WWU7_THACA|nr:hypothetical protein AG1IA_05155 [Rhizoctonia solani AG-1 IA]